MTDLDDVIRLLRDRRPEATDLELDEIKQRVRRRAAQPRRAQPMKSRLAILAMLVLGMLFSTAGAGLAVGGLAGSDSAAKSQYPDVQPEETPTGDVLPEETSGGGGGTGGDETPPTTQPQGEEEDVQPARQVEVATDSELPFTGFAAIPVMLGGIALLSAGLVLRRRASRDDG
jgi:hypothetical protein